jgi:hypothetical protein
MSVPFAPETFAQITDRFSMSQFFTKIYTTRSKRPSLKAIVLQSKISPELLNDIIIKRPDLDDFKIDVVKLSSDLYRISLTRKIGEGVFNGIFLLDISNYGSWVVLTNASNYYVNHVIESFYDKLYPKISRIYFNLEQMEKFVNIIKDEYGGKSTFRGFTIIRNKRVWKLGNEKYSSGTFNLWEENAEEEIKKQSLDYNIKIIRLNFSIKDKYDFILLRANISRKGKCSLLYGDFNNYYCFVDLTETFR